jgi:hypothetical protein
VEELKRLASAVREQERQMEELEKTTDQRHDDNRKSIEAMNRRWNRMVGMAIGIYVTWSFLTGSGIVSLNTLLHVLGK